MKTSHATYLGTLVFSLLAATFSVSPNLATEGVGGSEGVGLSMAQNPSMLNPQPDR